MVLSEMSGSSSPAKAGSPVRAAASEEVGVETTSTTATTGQSTTTSSSVTTSVTPKRGRGRPVPLPKPILDREALVKALDEADIPVKKHHLDGFYQALHRQHYPPLPEFVEQYYRNERDHHVNKLGQQQQYRHRKNGSPSAAKNGWNGIHKTNQVDDDNDQNQQKMIKEEVQDNPAAVKVTATDNGLKSSQPQQQQQQPVAFPLKNAVSNRKNRNRANLPKALLQFLADPNNGFVTLTSKVAEVKTSADASTTKLAIRLYDGQLVESVLMRYGPKVEEEENGDGGSATTTVIKKCGRASLCISSQVGCAMGCNFCATGMMGLTGNLAYAEILEQVVHAERILAREALERRTLQQQNISSVVSSSSGGRDNNNGVNGTSGVRHRKQMKKSVTNKNKSEAASDLDIVRNIVFMGMGEPLDNYSNVVAACRALIDRKRWNLAHGRVTVSTVGIASKIRKLTQDLPEVSLALSLHAPNQRLRSQIVPTAKHYPIEDMIDALDGHMKAALQPRKHDANTHHRPANGNALSTRRRAMIEYVMLEGETSSLECAHELGKLTEKRSVVVNLIPYNQTDVKDKLRCPSEEHIREFQKIVTSYGTFCTIRRTMGADIDSACGQLIVLDRKKREAQEQQQAQQGVVVDIEDGLVASSRSGVSALDVSNKRKAVSKKLSLTISSIPPTAAAQQFFLGTTQSTAESRETKKMAKVRVKEELPNNDGSDLERWIRPLQIATTVAASCFLVSTALYLRQSSKKR